jgi:hypothetical protein
VSKNFEAQLMRLLTQIFEDSVVTAEERSSLLEFQAGLDPARVQRVFKAFVEKKWGEALSDGVVTDLEKLTLRLVLEELALPDAAVPEKVRRALR